MNENTIQVGDKAPDFLLKDQSKNEIQLSKLKGKRILLSFHPLAWTGICAKQMKALDRNKDVFDRLNALAFGVSIDHVPCKYAWAKELNITRTSLLCDFWPHGAMAMNYGMFREAEGFSQRANVVVDEQGTAAFIKIYKIHELPDLNEIIDFLKDLHI